MLDLQLNCAYALQDHVEGYHKLSAKTKTFFSTAVALWDADFYVKVDDDVHLNLGKLRAPLLRSGNKTHLQEFSVRLEKTETSCPEIFMRRIMCRDARRHPRPAQTEATGVHWLHEVGTGPLRQVYKFFCKKKAAEHSN
jgi:hypothetical protein